ncbi:terminase large subunit domain-containing protein [Ferrimonas balearica]|uniref:terminase large subunit domain-containing protein n=1 Tax=Ferrimonas balearica TaxID=44012 RepID=UPI001C982C66|nr:terminase family protein [Ferrimonas balearica]MBY6223573.1 terminase family protein [Ferrimonas balearica]
MSAPATVPDLSAFRPDEVLLPYQKVWVADTSPLKIAEKSRRTGLTWAEAADAVLSAALSRAEGGGNHFYVGSNKEMAREFIDACALWATAFDKAAGAIEEGVLESGDKAILTFTLYFESGFKIQALSSNPANLRGMQGNVTIDEAAFHERLAEVLKAALALTMWGSKVRLISTHNGDDNLFNELIKDSRAGKKRYRVHTITLGDACQQGLYRRICQVRGVPWSAEAEAQWKANLLRDTATEEDALEEYYCKPKSGGGAYLSRALIEARMAGPEQCGPILRLARTDDFARWPENLRAVDILEWCQQQLQPHLEALNPALPHCLGEDFARSGDLTVLSVAEIGQNLHLTTRLQVELKNLPFSQQRQILWYLLDRLPRLRGVAMDARGNGQQLAEETQDKYGTELVAGVMLSETWYRENMPRFKAHFEDALITLPRDADTLADLRAIAINRRGVPRIDERTGADKSRHGDAAIALCLMVFASTLDGAPIEFTPLPDRPGEGFPSFERGCW